ncbi:MAG: FkbM family methyltransferase [Nannocystaceae bacterium]
MSAAAAPEPRPTGLVAAIRRLGFAATMEYKRRVDEPELALVPRLLRRDRAFLDVGANLGVYTYVARPHASRVYAVEPHPGMAAALRRHFAGDVEVLELALSDERGSVDLFIPRHEGGDLASRASLEEGANPGFTQGTVSIERARLDDLRLDPLALIKIDVEGHERSVLVGGDETLARDRPALLVEIEERHHPGESTRVFEHLGARDYDGFFLLEGALRPVADFDPARHQRPEDAKRPGAPRSKHYINNFLFLPREDAALRGRVGL